MLLDDFYAVAVSAVTRHMKEIHAKKHNASEQQTVHNYGQSIIMIPSILSP